MTQRLEILVLQVSVPKIREGNVEVFRVYDAEVYTLCPHEFKKIEDAARLCYLQYPQHTPLLHTDSDSFTKFHEEYRRLKQDETATTEHTDI